MNSGGGTVLLVDDDEPVLETYALHIEDHYETILASDGSEALDEMDETVDVVILDRLMPGKSGDDVLAEFRARGFDQPVGLLTAVSPDEDLLDLPADAYFVKPLERRAFIDAVDRLFARKRYDDEVREYFAIASKKAAMEANRTDAALTDSTAYQTLTNRTAELAERAGDALDDLDMDDAFVGFDD